MSENKKEMTFYSARGILIMIVIVIFFAVIALVGMYMLGIVSMPGFIKAFIDTPSETTIAPLAEKIAPEEEDAKEYEILLHRDEYANALADIAIPTEYYHNYTVSWLAGETERTVNYIAIYDEGNWWVQAEENSVITSTAICKDGKVELTNNSDNTSVITDVGDISFSEYFGYMPLEEAIGIIASLANGIPVSYGGGIVDYSLLFTPAQGISENIFNFSFTRKDGISEEYTFAFESSSILSITRYNANGEMIYQMKTKDSRNSIEDIDIDTLLTFKKDD